MPQLLNHLTPSLVMLSYYSSEGYGNCGTLGRWATGSPGGSVAGKPV